MLTLFQAPPFKQTGATMVISAKRLNDWAARDY